MVKYGFEGIFSVIYFGFRKWNIDTIEFAVGNNSTNISAVHN